MATVFTHHKEIFCGFGGVCASDTNQNICRHDLTRWSPAAQPHRWGGGGSSGNDSSLALRCRRKSRQLVSAAIYCAAVPSLWEIKSGDGVCCDRGIMPDNGYAGWAAHDICGGAIVKTPHQFCGFADMLPSNICTNRGQHLTTLQSGVISPPQLHPLFVYFARDLSRFRSDDCVAAVVLSVPARLCPVRSLNLFLLSSASHTLWDSLFSRTPVGFPLKDLCLMILTWRARGGLIRGRFALNTCECRARQAHLCGAIPSVDALCLRSLINLAVTEKSAAIHSGQRAPSSLPICSLVVGMTNYSNTFLFTLAGSCVPEE